MPAKQYRVHIYVSSLGLDVYSDHAFSVYMTSSMLPCHLEALCRCVHTESGEPVKLRKHESQSSNCVSMPERCLAVLNEKSPVFIAISDSIIPGDFPIRGVGTDGFTEINDPKSYNVWATRKAEMMSSVGNDTILSVFSTTILNVINAFSRQRQRVIEVRRRESTTPNIPSMPDIVEVIKSGASKKRLIHSDIERAFRLARHGASVAMFSELSKLTKRVFLPACRRIGYAYEMLTHSEVLFGMFTRRSPDKDDFHETRRCIYVASLLRRLSNIDDVIATLVRVLEDGGGNVAMFPELGREALRAAQGFACRYKKYDIFGDIERFNPEALGGLKKCDLWVLLGFVEKHQQRLNIINAMIVDDLLWREADRIVEDKVVLLEIAAKVFEIYNIGEWNARVINVNNLVGNSEPAIGIIDYNDIDDVSDIGSDDMEKFADDVERAFESEML